MEKPRGLRLSLAGMLILIALIGVAMSYGLRGGTRIVDMKKGTGPTVKKGDTVVVHYIGTLYDGTAFDDSTKRGVPLEIPVGQGLLIQGFDYGLVGMQAGGTRKLKIPPEEGYGEKGAPPVISPGATLYFQIDLLKIK